MLYISVFLIGFCLGILFAIHVCKIVEQGIKPRWDNFIHYLFRSESYTRTRIMDNLIDSVDWEVYHFKNENGDFCKICGVFQNVTNIEIRNIVLEFRFLDEDGVIIRTENHIEYGNTLPGEKRRLSILAHDLDFNSFNVIARTNSFAEIPHFK